MPIYQYRSEDGKLEETLHRSLEDRNLPVVVEGVTLKRVTVPERVFVLSGAEFQNQRDDVLAGYHRKECAEGSRFKSEFTKEQIKQIWSES